MELPHVCLRNHSRSFDFDARKHWFHGVVQGDQLYLRATHTTYRVSERELCSRSHVLRVILAGLRKGDRRAGKGTQFAVCFVNSDAQELGTFLKYIYATQQGAHPVHLANLEGGETFVTLHHILRLSSMLGVADGKQYAICRMDSLPQITYAQRIRVSSGYFIPSWFHSAAKHFVETPLTKWTPDDIANVGSEGLAWVIQILAKVYELRKQLVLAAPVVSPSPCGRPKCASHWAQAWRERAIPLILGNGPFSASPVGNAVFADLLTNPRHFCPSCWTQYLLVVQESFQREEAVVAELIAQWFDSVPFFDVESTTQLISRRSGSVE